MTPGDIVQIAVNGAPRPHIAVVVWVRDTQVKACVWMYKVGRWAVSAVFAIEQVTPAEMTDDRAVAALNNVRKNMGVIPTGGTGLSWVRVWQTRKA